MLTPRGRSFSLRMMRLIRSWDTQARPRPYASRSAWDTVLLPEPEFPRRTMSFVWSEPDRHVCQLAPARAGLAAAAPSLGQRGGLRPVRSLKLGVFVPGWPAFEDHGLGLQERQQSLASALASDAGLLEPAERDAEVGAERVVADGA